jgi:plastocyanin
MSLTKVINTGIKESEITGDKINVSSVFSFNVLQANTLTVVNDFQSNTINIVSLYANAAFDAANNATDSWVRDAANSGSSYANSSFNRANSNYISAVTQLVVTTPVFNYNIDQYSGDNPTIYVSAGETIVFDLTQTSSHPFAIRVSNGGSNYDTGLIHVANDGTISTGSSAQGKFSGKLYWKIPFELAGLTYVYQCTNHSSMVGNIVIQTPVSFVASNSQLAFNTSNSASSYANSAYIQANTPSQTANSAGVYANGAFVNSNTVYNSALQADQRAVTSGLYANAAFSRANVSLNAQSGGTVTGDVSISGNLTVTGCTATLTVSTFRTSDHIIDVGFNTTGTPTQNAGIRVLRGDLSPTQIRWEENADAWEFTNDGTNYLKIGSQSGENYANGAFAKANTANTLAQAAYDQANTSGGGSGLFNPSINVAVGYGVTSTLANAVVFSANSIVHSIYLTNISNVSTSNIQVTGDFTASGSSNVSIFYKIPLPYRSSVEILKKPQVVKTNDILKLQSFNNDVGVSANAYAIIVYETTNLPEYERISKLTTTSYTNMYTSTSSPSVIESIKLVNQDSAYGNHAITLVWTNSANTLQGYFTKDLILPANSTIELCETPKYVNAGDKIDAYSTFPNVVSVLISAKKIV